MSDNLVLVSLVSGGVAGTCTDLFFFPIDTLKTRLQAKGGFFANGGWKGVYRGLGSVVVASAPGASLFFLSYEISKKNILPYSRNIIPDDEIVSSGVTHMIAASIGEIAACSIRVPAEVIKQRAQASQFDSSLAVLKSILRNTSKEGIWLGLYRGWGSTILREIPFTIIQFPLYEYLKSVWAQKSNSKKVSLSEGAVCGMIAGGTAGAITTPLDVVKTRLMLSNSRMSVWSLASTIAREDGYSAFLKGIGPRTMWISAGGAIFLGVYEAAKRAVTGALDARYAVME